ncbi:MAG: hypothetical protein DME15_03080 [Candidatus Rokuibacteriota bacterium]|nr:MAG: hypothetical protein DME15_03080 [Candidatus Rokubacteria bacterium]
MASSSRAAPAPRVSAAPTPRRSSARSHIKFPCPGEARLRLAALVAAPHAVAHARRLVVSRRRPRPRLRRDQHRQQSPVPARVDAPRTRRRLGDPVGAVDPRTPGRAAAAGRAFRRPPGAARRAHPQPEALADIVLGHARGGGRRPPDAPAATRGGRRAARDLAGDAGGARAPALPGVPHPHALPVRPLRQGGPRRPRTRDAGVPGGRADRGHGAPRQGDDPRLIHWRSSAKSGGLIVRELQADSARDTRIVLQGAGERDAARLERGLARAASLAVHLLRAGASVELFGRGVHVPRGAGPAQRTRVLTALALYDPGAAAAAPVPERRGGPAREIDVELD